MLDGEGAVLVVTDQVVRPRTRQFDVVAMGGGRPQGREGIVRVIGRTLGGRRGAMMQVGVGDVFFHAGVSGAGIGSLLRQRFAFERTEVEGFADIALAVTVGDEGI